MAETKATILGLFQANPWLTGVHIHVGSQVTAGPRAQGHLGAGRYGHTGTLTQGVPLDKFVEGCRVLMDFVGEVEALVPGQLAVIDIGGQHYTRPGQKGPNLALTIFYWLDSEFLFLKTIR